MKTEQILNLLPDFWGKLLRSIGRKIFDFICSLEQKNFFFRKSNLFVERAGSNCLFAKTYNNNTCAKGLTFSLRRYLNNKKTVNY